MMDADIEELVAQGPLSEKAISGWQSCTGEAFPSEDRTEMDTPDVVSGAAFSLRQGGKYPEASFKDRNKRWAEEWFVVANPTPGLPSRTGLLPVLNARWKEKPTEEEMVEVEVLLAELQKLKAENLTSATMALSFDKRLTQPIEEPVHPGYEYSGREDPTRVQNCKVSRSEAHRRVTLIVSGEVRDKGCPKAYCLKWPTTEEKSMSFWCPAHLPEGQQGKAVDPPARLALPAVDVGSFSSDSSIGSKSDDVVESLPSAVLLKPSFNVQWTGRRASLSGAKCKAEESTHEASLAEVAQEEGVAANAKEEKLPEEKAPGEEAVMTKEALLEAAQRATKATQALADLSRRAAIQLAVADGSASRVLQLEEELRALKRHHSEASKKQSAKLKELNEANETMARELKVVVAANDELHQLREGAEGQESLTEEKLRLEKQRCQVSFAKMESRLADARADLDQLMPKIDVVLVAFEPEGVALAEEAARRMNGARERPEAFVRKTDKDSMQFAMALVKSHNPEVDLDPVGEGVAEDCTDAEWDSHFATVGPLAERIMGQVNM
ncbi:hypothetical protein C2845_PM17G06750 [Panicum miliaceum]|uniref:Uncharacterized protein n=1 Tax=Panicum miliaceum TaxID=4540 RepID=A0A3L6PYV7_PANMI|nr:hypothetical protein C2845_PM17G06750 [Panicum miliaceum]